MQTSEAEVSVCIPEGVRTAEVVDSLTFSSAPSEFPAVLCLIVSSGSQPDMTASSSAHRLPQP